MPRAPSQYSREDKWYIQQLRKICQDWPPKDDCINAARRAPDKYECAHCKQLYRRTVMKADHIDPVIDPNTGWQGRGVYAQRLFIDLPGWQALCAECHQIKTNQENKIRREVAKQRLTTAAE